MTAQGDIHGKSMVLLVLCCFAILLVLCRPGPSLGSMHVLHLHSADAEVELGTYFQFLEDSSKQLTIEQVSAPEFSERFIQNKTASIRRGITDSAYWFRLALRPSEHEGNGQLQEESSDPSLWFLWLRRDLDYYDEVQVFRTQPGVASTNGSRWTQQTYGMYAAIENGQRGPAAIALSLRSKAQETEEIYLRVVANGGINFKPVLLSVDGYNRFVKKLSLFYGAYHGIVLAVLAFNLFHFLFLRERVRLIYMVYVLTLSTYFFVTNEMSMALIPASLLAYTSKAGQFLSLLTFALSAWFAIAFLEAKKTIPLLYRLLQLVLLVSLVTLFLLPFFSYYSLLKPITNLGKATILIIISSGLLAWFRGYQPARFFLLGWAFCMGGAVIYVLNFQGSFPYAFLGAKAYQAGAAIEMVLLSLAIADRMKFLFSNLATAQAKRQQQLNALTEQLIQSEERERRRIAGLLHDSIGQSLVATKWEAERLLRECGGKDTEDSKLLPFLDTCIEETRTLTSEFYPRALYEAGLGEALNNLAGDHEARFDLSVSCFIQGSLAAISRELQLIIYRAVSELLNNVIKHAAASQVEIDVIATKSLMTVSVADNGVGFDYGKTPNQDANSIGLFSIEERLQHLGGSLEVGRNRYGGATVSLAVPLPAEPL